MVVYSTSDLRAALTAAAATVPALSADRYVHWRLNQLEHGHSMIPSLNTIIQRFGSWNAALDVCGWEPRNSVGGPRARWTRPAVIDVLQVFLDDSRRGGLAPTRRNYQQWSRTRSVPSVEATRRHGTFTELTNEAADRAAGEWPTPSR